MAGDWIKMKMSLQSHPKVVRILSATNSDKFRVVGGLHAVWSVFDQHSEDGVLSGYTPDTMDHIIGWEGFSQAMIDVGWLAFTEPETLIMPDFEAHNGASAKRRAEDAERKRRGRTADKCPQNVRKKTGTFTEKKRTREEKRREDIYKVFQTYQKVMASPRSKLTEDKKKKIKARLDEGFTVEELENAILGCAASGYHMGGNPDRKKYNSIELIFRNGTKTEEFIKMAGESGGDEGAFV